jgi:cytochrome c oxidase subunit 4
MLRRKRLRQDWTMAHPTVKPPTYILVFAALLVLTGLTVGASQLPLGGWHIVVALAIAVTKAALVFLYFMHMLHSPRLFWVVALGGLLWLSILIAMTMNDYLTRDWSSMLAQ